MALLLHTYFLILLSVLLQLLQGAGATCFWPDRSVDTGGIACNSTAGGAISACCGRHDICSTRGYCMGSAGFMYRGGCTDENWNSPNCAAQCKQGVTILPEPWSLDNSHPDKTTVSLSSFSNIYPCARILGSYTTDFCCGATEGGTPAQVGCCNTTNFDFAAAGGTGRFFNPDYNKTEPVSSSTATPTVASLIASSTPTPSTAAVDTQTPAPATTSPRPTSNKRNITIGLGVGVPIAVIALSLLGFLLLRERRRRTHAEKTANDVMEAKRQSDSDATLARAGNMNPPGMFVSNERRMMQELPSDPIPVNELQSRQIHEAGNWR